LEIERGQGPDPMVMKDLTDLEARVYEHIRANDFSSRPWITMNEARRLGITEEALYKALSELTKKIKDNVWIYYEAGHLHVVAD